MSKEFDEKRPPPYHKYAFANPYNYAVLGGFFSAALFTGNWWLGVAGLGYEGLWMLFAPDSTLLRKFWFDKRFKDEQAAARAAAMQAKLALLPRPDANRCVELIRKQDQIDHLAKENPAFTADLLGGELAKLGDLVNVFVDLAVTCTRYEEYLETIDIDDLERDLRRYQQEVEREGDTNKRALAQKNLSVLIKRKEKVAELKSYLGGARSQLDLIENTFRFLADQIVTMRSPKELGGQLDELLDGVEAVRQTARETDKILGMVTE